MNKLFLFFLLLFTQILQPLFVFGEPSNYTYNYDFWGEQVVSPDAYRVTSYILGATLGIGNFRDPQGLFVRENRVYICDSGNNRIVRLLALDDGSYEIDIIVNSININGVQSAFNYPMDIFECRDGYLYIADTNNQRILKLDQNWNHIFTIYRPDDESLELNAEFLPLKLALDFAGRLFVQARNVNKGLMEFDNRGIFSGFMGANRVYVNIIDWIWRIFSTQEQRARQTLFIPTEYNNLSLDNSGFIYVTNTANEYTDPIRRLNAMGQDILIRNGYERPIGDIAWGNAAGISGRSQFIDAAPFPNDSYAVFDRARGRIFVYDFQGNLLYAFGGVGNREGYFLQPVALANSGYTLFALDSRAAAITRFDLTAYGILINSALEEYRAGRYESSANLWEEVLKMNGNYDLAYIGIGRAAMREGDFRRAMHYYSLKHHRQGYSRAFQLYRKQWIETNISYVVLAIAVLVLTLPAVKFTRKFIREVREA